MEKQTNRRALNARQRGLSQAGVMVVLTLVTMLGAYVLFYFSSSGGLWGTTNKGEFVDSDLSALIDGGFDADLVAIDSLYMWLRTGQMKPDELKDMLQHNQSSFHTKLTLVYTKLIVNIVMMVHAALSIL